LGNRNSDGDGHPPWWVWLFMNGGGPPGPPFGGRNGVAT
jgi:hypothetical protein